MIIIQTSNGIKLINDHRIITGDHDKEKAQFKALIDPKLPFIVYENVESVVYVNEAEPTKIEDKGSMVIELEAQFNKLQNDSHRWHLIGRYFIFDFLDNLKSVTSIENLKVLTKEAEDRINEFTESMSPKD